jgi:hypothetical protein
MNKVLLLLVTMLVGLLGLTGAASAETSFTNLGVFAQAAADGQAAHQHRIAVNHTSGDVYVTNVADDRIDVYRPSVAGDSAAALTTFGTGELTNPYGIAIDQSTGDVYVSDATQVVRYTSDNAPTPAFTKDNTFTSPSVTGPLAFDAANDQLLVADTATNTVRRYATTGSAIADAAFDGTAGAGSPGAFVGLQDLAVDSTGDVIVVDATGNPALNNGSVSRVERFASNGAWEATVGPVAGAATVAVRGGDELIVSDRQNNVFTGGHATLHRFAADGTALDDIPSDALSQYSIVSGIASDDGVDGSVYVATDNGDYNGSYIYGNPSVQIFQARTFAEADVSAPTDITTTAATLHGTVNPRGGPDDTTYHFELSGDNDVTWAAVDPDGDGDENAGQSTTDIAVTETLSDLAAGGHYGIRLVASRRGLLTTSRVVRFATDTLAPDASTARATAVDSTSAKLNATINPHGEATTYYFEYGTTTAYGNRYPASTSASAGAGTTDRAVSLTLAGLSTVTSYHYRVIATNAKGTIQGTDQSFTTKASPDNKGPDGCPNAAIRATQHAAFLPECRAYEMVSPPDKGGADVNAASTVQTPESGDGALFSSPNGLPGTSISTLQNYFRVGRTATSWDTESIEPPFHNTAGLQFLSSPATSADLTATLQVSRVALAPGAVEGAGNIYLRDNRTGQRKLIASGPPSLIPGIVGAGAFRFGDGTPSFDHVVFDTPAKLTDDAIAGANNNVYEYSAEAGLRLVDVLPDGSTDPVGGTVYSGAETDSHGAISDDGRRIVFLGHASEGLFLREGGTTTAISVSQRSGDPDTPQPSAFLAMTADGSQVFFTSSTRLTDDSTAMSSELYRYDVASGRLTDLTIASDPADSSGAYLAKVLSVSDSGDRVYFEAFGNLAPGGMSGASNLYEWSPAGTRFIAALDPGEYSGPGSWSMSPSGRFFAFESVASITGVDNRSSSCGDSAEAQCREVFVYDADTQAVRCVSCDAAGAPGHARVGAANYKTFAGEPGAGAPLTISGYRGRAVTDDGRVFFLSEARLVAGDTNGKRDVYEWDGTVPRLISTGKSTSDSGLADISADGSTAFFFTGEALVSQDVDTNVDLYAARTNGGLGAQNKVPVPEVPCREDGCQGRPSSPPGSVVVGSVTFAGEGNPPLPGAPRAKGTGPKVTKPKTIAGTSARLQVKVPGKGRIAVSGSGLSSVSRTAKKAGSYRVSVRLSRVAQRALKRKHRLTVQVTVRFTPSGGEAQSVRVSLTFKTTTAKKGRS